MKLIFKYNFFQDIKWAYRTIKNKEDLLSKNLVVFTPSILRMVYLWFNLPRSLSVDTPYKIICYWISSGTWGSYTPPNKIFICPWKKDGGTYTSKELEKVIHHELLHLYNDKETEDWSFEEREKFIRKKMTDEVHNP